VSASRGPAASASSSQVPLEVCMALLLGVVRASVRVEDTGAVCRTLCSSTLSVFGRPRRVEVQRDVESATAFARVETLSNGSRGESRVRRAPLRNRSKRRERAEPKREREAGRPCVRESAVQFSAQQTLTDTHTHTYKRSHRPRALRNKFRRPETTGVPRPPMILL